MDPSKIDQICLGVLTGQAVLKRPRQSNAPAGHFPPNGLRVNLQECLFLLDGKNQPVPGSDVPVQSKPGTFMLDQFSKSPFLDFVAVAVCSPEP